MVTRPERPLPGGRRAADAAPSWGRPLATLALAVSALLVAGPLAAQESAQAPEGWAYELAGELMSPFCPGVTISECPSASAKSLKMWMVMQEAAGRSRADVEEELYARYGDRIRPAPKPEGFGLTAYVIPVLAFLGGGVLLFWFLRRQTRGGGPPPPAAPSRPLDPELARRVDEEIAR